MPVRPPAHELAYPLRRQQHLVLYIAGVGLLPHLPPGAVITDFQKRLLQRAAMLRGEEPPAKPGAAAPSTASVFVLTSFRDDLMAEGRSTVDAFIRGSLLEPPAPRGGFHLRPGRIQCPINGVT